MDFRKSVLNGSLTASFEKSYSGRPGEPYRAFLPESKIRQILTPDTVRLQLVALLKSFGHTLEQTLGFESNETYLDAIVNRAPRLFALLILCEKEAFIFDFIQQRMDDSSLPLTKSEIFGVLKRNPDQVFERQWIVQAHRFTKGFDYDLDLSLRPDSDLESSPWINLPFTSEDSLGKGVDRVTVPLEYAAQFVPSYNHNLPQQTSMFVARKTIATRNASKSDKLSLNDALRREKSVLQKLLALGTDHRHLVELFASYKLDGNYYLLLTCADYDLEDLFDKNSGPPEFGTTAEQQSATLYGSLYCLASALDYLHRLPNHHPDLGLSEIIYHHDLKPANILIKGKKFLVADFGLSGLKHQDDTKTDWHGGTYSYSPPEYLSSFKTTSASGGRQVDIWSLGCIFSEIVTLAIKGWRSDSVSRFKSWRANGPSVHLFNPDAPDSSFHNNLPEVKSWLHDILAKDGNSLTSLVGIIDRTLSIEPAKRPSSEILCQDLTRVLPRGYLDICGCART